MKSNPFPVTFCIVALLTISVAWLVTARQSISAPKAAAPAVAPKSSTLDTPAAKLGQQLLGAINTGQAEALVEFLDQHLSRDLCNQMTRAKYLHQLRRLQEQSGGLEFKRTFMTDAKMARLLTTSRKQGHPLGVEIVLDPADAGRAVWIGLHQLPGTGPHPSPLPTLAQSTPEQITAIRAHVSEVAKLNQFSGSVLVAHGNDILLNEAWGKVHEGRSESLRPDTLYDTASVGKMFTAVVIAQLVERGKLSYSDTIAKWLPDFPNSKTAGRVTLSQLLTHTGGLGDPFDSPLVAKSDTFKLQSDWFVTFADKPLRFPPGDHHDYSNGGYVVLAAIIEKVTGLRFADYLRKNIFEPAGMSHTGKFKGSEQATVAVPHTHSLMDDPLGIEPRQPKTNRAKPQDGCGMGGWTTTTEDLFQFGRALKSGRLISADSVELLTTGKVPVLPGASAFYGYGFYDVPLGGNRLVGHSGGGGDCGVGADLELLWKSDFTVVILGNHDLPETTTLMHALATFLARQNEKGAFAATR